MPDGLENESKRLSKSFFKFTKYLKKIFCFIKSKLIYSKNSSSEDLTYDLYKKRLLNFSKMTVEDSMVPRSDLVALKEDSTKDEIINTINNNAHKRVLIYRESLDDIKGFIHIKDLFLNITSSDKIVLNDIIRPHLITAHSTKIVDLLTTMRSSKTHIAIVIDEYGGTDGIITIEDIIKQIFGEIEDEHDVEQSDGKNYSIIQPGLIITEARLSIEELEGIMKVKLVSKDDEIDTIGGLVVSIAGNIPKRGEKIRINDNLIAEIIDSTPRSITKLRLKYKM